MKLAIPTDPKILRWGWIGLLAVGLLLAGMLLVWLPQTSQTSWVVKNELLKLDQQLREVEKQIQGDQERYVNTHQRFPWIMDGVGGTVFLTRLSGVAAGQRLGISGVGPVERKKVGQVERISRKVKLVSSFSDVVALVENTERNLGIIEGLKVEQVDQKAGKKGLGDLEAQFNMVTVELNPDVKKKLQTLIGSAPAPSEAKEGSRSSVLPAPNSEAGLKTAQLRNPFRAVASPGADGKLAVGAGGGGWPPFPEVRFSGIVNLPNNKKMAVINNQMVQEGERVGEVLVERITDSEIVLKSGSEVKRIKLGTFAANISGKE